MEDVNVEESSSEDSAGVREEPVLFHGVSQNMFVHRLPERQAKEEKNRENVRRKQDASIPSRTRRRPPSVQSLEKDPVPVSKKGPHLGNFSTLINNDLNRLHTEAIQNETRLRNSIKKQLKVGRTKMPMSFLFKHNVNECRDRMKKAVVDVVVRLQKQARKDAFKKWKKYLRILDQEEQKKFEDFQLRMKQTNAIKVLDRCANVLKDGKPFVKVFYRFWVQQTIFLRQSTEGSASCIIQKYYRRHAAQKKTILLKEEKEDARKFLFALLFLEKSYNDNKLKEIKMETIARDRRVAARRIQNYYRCYIARIKLRLLYKEWAENCRTIESCVNIQKLWRGLLGRKLCRDIRKANLLMHRDIREKCRKRFVLSVHIQRVYRGYEGRKISKLERFEWQRRDKAARMLQKAYRVSKGSYALQVKIAARRERDALLMKEKRKEAATKMQCFFRNYLARQMLKRLRIDKANLLEKQHTAAARIQIFWWRIIGNNELAARAERRRIQKAIEKTAANDIQRVWQGYKGRQYVRKKKARLNASLIIQRTVRCFISRQMLFKLRQERELLLQVSSTIIQCFWRCKVARDELKSRRKQNASGIIQRNFRGWISRQETARIRKELELARAQKLLEICSATNIQKVFRGHKSRLYVTNIRENIAACIIQNRTYRSVAAKKRVFRIRSTSARQASRLTAELRWQIVDRGTKARKLQCKYRMKLARAALRTLRKAKRDAAATKIQRLCKMFLAKTILKRLKLHRAASFIQTGWRHMKDRCVLKSRFQKRRQRIDLEHKMAKRMQSCWRMKKQKERFRKIIKDEKKRRYMEAYKLEREKYKEIEADRMKKLDIERKHRLEALTQAKTEAYENVHLRAERRLNKLYPPGWCKNLPDIELMHRVIERKTEARKLDEAWKEVYDEQNGVPYYFNEISQQSQWEKPDYVIQREIELGLNIIEKVNVQPHEMWKWLPCARCNNKSSIHDVLCNTKDKSMVDSLLNVITHGRAVLNCAHCELPLCHECSAKIHQRGARLNHAVSELSSLKNKDVCLRCSEYLTTTICKVCKFKYCTKCFQATHARGNMKTHKTERILHHEIPKPKRNETVCPHCLFVLATKKCTHCMDYYCDACYEFFHRRGRRKEHDFVPANEELIWKENYDVNSARYYYFNTTTGETTWEKPYVLMTDEERKKYDRAKKKAESQRNQEYKRIDELKEKYAELEEWKERIEIQEKAEEEAQAPSEYQRKSLWKNLQQNPTQIMGNPVKVLKEHQNRTHQETKAYLNKMLRDNADFADADAAMFDKEANQAFKTSMLVEMAEDREKQRKEQYMEAVSKLTAPEFKKRLSDLQRKYHRTDMLKELAKECAKFDIKYGPKIRDGPDKLDKNQALEALVYKYHEKEIQQKAAIEEHRQRREHSRKVKQKLKDLERLHKLGGKKKKGIKFFN